MPTSQTSGLLEEPIQAAPQTQAMPSVGAEASTEKDEPVAAADRSLGVIVLDEERPFHIVPHMPAQEVPYGTLCLRLKPRSTGGYRPLVTKGAADHGDPQRLCLAMRDDRIVVALAIPYTRTVCEWELETPTLHVGKWIHLALAFDDRGTTLYVDGQRVPEDAWRTVRGPHAAPSEVTDFSLENNARPIVLGYPRQSAPEASDAGQTPTLQDRYFGPIEFALWGGFAPQCLLTPEQILWLASQATGRSPLDRPEPRDDAPDARGKEPAMARASQTGPDAQDDVPVATPECEPEPA